MWGWWSNHYYTRWWSGTDPWREVTSEKKPDNRPIICFECMNKQEGMSHGNTWRKNILGRVNSRCKAPELGMTLAYLKTRKKMVELRHSE